MRSNAYRKSEKCYLCRGTGSLTDPDGKVHACVCMDKGRARMRNYTRTQNEDGTWCDSKLENAVYDLLKFQQRTGIVSELQAKPVVPLTAGINWRVDFVCFENNKKTKWYHEAKGQESEVYLLKKKLWRVYGPAPLTIWKGNYKKPYEDETILPDKWLTNG